MVETAIVFPLLVLIALALVQFAIYYHVHNVVEAAVQEGARLGARRDADPDAGAARASDVIHAGMSQRLADSINVTPRTLNSGDPDEAVQITADGGYPTFLPWFSFGNGPSHITLPLHAVAVVSKERFRGGR